MEKILKQKLLVTLWVLMIAFILYVFPISCPILSITGIPCLGCGMTRAFLCAVHLDFHGAFRQHMMFWSLPLLYICFWKDGVLFRAKKWNILLYLFILTGFLFNWICHVF